MKRSEFVRMFGGLNQSMRPDPQSGINPYTGPWTTTQVVHLLRRATFGVRKSEVDQLLSLGMNAAVDKLLDTAGAKDPIPSPPLNVYSTPAEPDPTTPYGQTFINAPAVTPIPPQYYQARTDVFKAWWAGNMIHQKMTITEKLTLFWFNHFALEADTVQIAQAMYYYYKLLRENALGNFKTMVKLVSVDPAMLRYLNGQLNSKAAPDENYARELQELFTIGKGPDATWTEDDVKAAAKVLTGYRINPLTTPISYYFDFNQHDLSTKRFSTFYNNKTITGKFGPAGEQELDELINMLTDNIETARHMVRKLYQFFVYYEIPNDVEMNVIRPLADLYKSSGYDNKKVVETLFKSEHFYDMLSVGCIIKSPLDYSIGLTKEFSIKFPDQSNLVNQYLSWGLIASLSAYQGLNIADPPVVSGWQAWYQSPQSHEIWINADTLANRNRVAENITSSKGVEFNGISLKVDPIILASSFSQPQDALQLVKDSVAILYNYTLSDTSIQYLKSFLIQGLPGDSYWTDIWLEYTGNPTDPALKNAVTLRLNALFKEIISQAEYHLS